MDISTITGNAQWQEIMNKLGGPLSFLVQLGFVIFIAVFAIQAGYAWIGYFMAQDPQSKSMKKDNAINKLKGLGYSLVAYIAMKMVLGVFGVSGLLK
jgi:hypothetical protein